MDCKQFDGQVVRLERFKDIASKFVLVRLTRVDNLDLSLFEFDYDLTMMIFFMDGREKIYARYGGRDATSADARQSLDGLRYTMLSVLDMHAQDQKEFAPRTKDAPTNARTGFGRRGCMHCHQVRERLDAQIKSAGKWTRDMFWRYPLPENVGISLDVNRSNIVKAVADKSPAAALGIKPGDMLKRLGAVPIHSFGDAQFALTHAPTQGDLAIAWQHDGKTSQGKLTLTDGWRKTNVSWRPSIQHFLPQIRLSGTDLNTTERKQLGLTEKQLAFRQRDAIAMQARTAGIRPGDIILGVDGKQLQMDSFGFIHFIQENYFAGDRVTVNLLRDGQRMDIAMTLAR